LTAAEEQKLLSMVSEIYHHLGLDGQRPVDINKIKIDAERDILKWQEKKRKKRNERETS